MKYSRLWGALCAFLPAIASAHLCETHLMRPKFHQHLICREIPIEAADVAIIGGAWVCGMVWAANFSPGVGPIHQLSPSRWWISLTAPLGREIYQKYLGEGPLT